MSGELAVSLALKLNDQGSGPATQALGKITRAMKEVGDTAKSTSAAAITAFQKLATSREILGIRSEKAIQNEIKLTEAAYQRLAASGQASARELGRAQDAMRQKVAALRAEMDGAKQSAAGMPRALSVAMGVVGGWQAGKMIVGEPVKQTMAYDRALANLANTAYAGQSKDERRAGMRTLDAAIVSAVRYGGGTREGAMGALDKLVASGAFSDVNEAAGLLPTLTRAGTAANTDPAQLADIAIRAKQTFGLKNTGLALDQAIKAGQLGGFELKDMAKWLPQQMAAGRLSGLKGDDGYRTLLALNQAAAITAGTKDEAGNNVVNLLTKINSQDTANDFKKLGYDLSGSLSAARAKGVNSVDAFGNLIEHILSKDKNYVELRKKAKTETGDEQKATYEAMADIAMGKGIGKTVQDRQALMPLIAKLQFREYVDDVFKGISAQNARGTGDSNWELIAETPSYKTEMLAAEKAIAMQTALERVNPQLGSFADGLTGVMREWPGFSAAIVGATLTLTALAAAAGAAALPGLLFGRGAGAAAAGAAGAGGAGATASRIALGGLGAASLATAPLGAMWGVSEWIGDESHDRERIEGIQNGPGATFRKYLSYLGIDKDAAIEARRAKNREGLDTSSPPPVNQNIAINIDGKTVAEVVNAYNGEISQRH